MLPASLFAAIPSQDAVPVPAPPESPPATGRPLTVHLMDILFLQIEGHGKPASSKSIGAIFPTAFTHLASVSHFGNMQHLSFFITVACVMMICES